MARLVSTKTIKSFEKGPVRRSLFSNGAVSLFHQFKGMESASANLYFLAGSIFENEKEEGLAHAIEHMLFKEESSSALVKEMEREGAQINAYTYKEYVCFELDCAASLLKKFLPSFLSLFLNPVFKPEDLELEKKVILQELREDKDDHETEGMEFLYKKNFPRALGHSIGGSLANVRSFTVKELESFYNRYYLPERMVLSVVSGKPFNALEEILSKALSAHPQKIKAPYRPKIAGRFSKLEHSRSKLKRSMESSILFYSFDGPSVTHQDYYNYLVLDEYLLGGMSSKLFLELREKYGYVYGLGSALNSYAQQGSYMMIFHSLKENIPKIRAKVDGILRELALEGFDESEIESIKKRVAIGWSLGFDGLLERNEYLAEMELLGIEDFRLARQVERLEMVSAKSLRQLAKKMVSRPHSTLVISS